MIEGVSALTGDLVDFIDIDNTVLRQFQSKSALPVSDGARCFPHPRPRRPASVSVVASAMANWTCKVLAIVCASSVLPEPDGPSIRILDFAAPPRYPDGKCAYSGCIPQRTARPSRGLPDDILIEHGLKSSLQSRQALGLDHRGFFAFVRGKSSSSSKCWCIRRCTRRKYTRLTGNQFAPDSAACRRKAFPRFFITYIRHMAPLSG